MLLIAEIDQRVQALDRLSPDRTTIAAIPAIWPTVFDEFFAPKGHATAATPPERI